MSIAVSHRMTTRDGVGLMVRFIREVKSDFLPGVSYPLGAGRW